MTNSELKERSDKRWMDVYNIIIKSNEHASSQWMSRVFLCPCKFNCTLNYIDLFCSFLSEEFKELGKLWGGIFIRENTILDDRIYTNREEIKWLSGLDESYNWSVKNKLIIERVCIFKDYPALELKKTS